LHLPNVFFCSISILEQHCMQLIYLLDGRRASGGGEGSGASTGWISGG